MNGIRSVILAGAGLASLASCAPAVHIGFYRPFGFYDPWALYQPWGWGFYGAPAWSGYAVPVYGGGRRLYSDRALVVVLRDRPTGQVAWSARLGSDALGSHRLTQDRVQEIADRLFTSLR
jgi:hypothetical protein